MGNVSSCFEGFKPPQRPKGKLVLKYFDIAGRAEPIRLALALGEYTFQDVRLRGEEWGEKEKESAPFKQLPVLYIDGVPLAQTKAILRYLGRVTQFQGKSLYPTDPYVSAKVDEIMDAFDDLWILLAPTYRIQNQAQKEQARQRLFEEGEAKGLIQIFESTLAKSTNGYVIAEAGFSVADLMYFAFLSMVRSGFVEGLGPKLLSGYPHILRHKELVAAMPEVQKYYKKQNNAGCPFYEVFLPGN
eukprot:symbB.v1.2.003070.t1/scaffold124.1/size443775/10